MSHTKNRVLAFVAAVCGAWFVVGDSGLAQTTSASLAALTPAPTPTLWRFLGIPQGVHAVRDTVVNRCGNLPGLERKPPLLRIADPRLAEIDNAAIKKAQQIKAEEDLAPQKIKAIKYLATLGCEKCYGGVEEAMLESLKDCTEAVRYETVKALATIPSAKCPACDNDCCSEKITEQLAKMAYERDPDAPDCWLEPSARVRQAAMETLRVCCRGQQLPLDADAPAERVAPQTPVEGGGGETPVEGAATTPKHAARHATRRRLAADYDYAMEVHVVPRRGESEDAAPDPRAQQSVVVTSFRGLPTGDVFVDSDAVRNDAVRGADVRPAAFVEGGVDDDGVDHIGEDHIREDDIGQDADAPLPRAATTPQRSPSGGVRSAAQPFAQTNGYGRRYVTWGTPHGEYAPPVRKEPRPVVRRGLFD